MATPALPEPHDVELVGQVLKRWGGRAVVLVGPPDAPFDEDEGTSFVSLLACEGGRAAMFDGQDEGTV